MYSIANSHLILSAEESSKALILYFKYQMNDKKFPVKKMFKSHKDKHYLTRDNFSFFLRKFLEIMGKMIASNRSTFTEEVLSQMEHEDETDVSRFILERFEIDFKKFSTLNYEKSKPAIDKGFVSFPVFRSI